MLSITTKDGAPNHYHLLWLDEAKGEGLVSSGSGKDKHTHEIKFIPEVSDPATGEVLSEAEWIILPDEKDGHVHSLDEFRPKKTKRSKDSDREVLSEVIALYKEAKEINATNEKKAKESWEFVNGDQWSHSMRNKLETENRPALTMNHTGKAIDTLVGIQIQNRTEWNYTPFEDGDQVEIGRAHV